MSFARRTADGNPSESDKPGGCWSMIKVMTTPPPESPKAFGDTLHRSEVLYNEKGIPHVHNGKMWVRLVVPIRLTGVAEFVAWMAAAGIVFFIIAFIAETRP